MKRGEFMTNDLLYDDKYEYSLTVENVTLRFFIHETKPIPWIAPAYDPALIKMTDHTHTFTEMFVCLQDQLILSTADGVITLQPEEALIIPPHISHHSVQWGDEEKWISLSFSCSRTSAHTSADLASVLVPFTEGTELIRLTNHPDLTEQVRQIRLECRNGNRLSASLRLMQMLVYISDHCLGETHRTQTEMKGADSAEMRMFQLDHMITSEFMRDLSVSYVAEQLFVSERQLARIVRKRYGCTLHRIVTDKRLSTAEYLLLSGNLSAEKIAHMVGFRSKTSFWREFTRKYGVTPAEYRRKGPKIP